MRLYLVNVPNSDNQFLFEVDKLTGTIRHVQKTQSFVIDQRWHDVPGFTEALETLKKEIS